MESKQRKRELINTINLNKPNLLHIAETGKINGNLLLEIESIMESYAIEYHFSRCNNFPLLFDFRGRRELQGITLRELENATGISNAYLSQLETGKIKSPSYNVVKKLTDYYDSIEHLING